MMEFRVHLALLMLAYVAAFMHFSGIYPESVSLRWAIVGAFSPEWLQPTLKAVPTFIFAGLLGLFIANDALHFSRGHEVINNNILAVGKVIAVAALGIMVCLILAQVVFRQLGDALNWTEEAARFGMLWLTGLMAPIAFRHGGFVSIDMLERALPRVLSAILTLILLTISMAVLIVAWDKGLNNHVDSLTGRGSSASLRIPLDMIGGETIKFKNQWQYASLWVGVNLLILVNAELIIRQIITLLGGGDRLKDFSTNQVAGAD